MHQWTEFPLSGLPISRTKIELLARAGFRTLGDVDSRPPRDLDMLRGIGQVTRDLIRLRIGTLSGRIKTRETISR